MAALIAVARRRVNTGNALFGLIDDTRGPATDSAASTAAGTGPTHRCPFQVLDEALPEVHVLGEPPTPPLPGAPHSCRPKSATDPNSRPQEGHSNHTRAPGGIRTRTPPPPMAHGDEGHTQRAPCFHAWSPTCGTAPLEETAQGPTRTETCTCCESRSSVRER